MAVFIEGGGEVGMKCVHNRGMYKGNWHRIPGAYGQSRSY